MLFNEPKLLKLPSRRYDRSDAPRFSALQRAEIAEIWKRSGVGQNKDSFSALQRAEIAEIGVVQLRRL